jgi:hypothetical protein
MAEVRIRVEDKEVHVTCPYNVSFLAAQRLSYPIIEIGRACLDTEVLDQPRLHLETILFDRARYLSGDGREEEQPADLFLELAEARRLRDQLTRLLAKAARVEARRRQREDAL